MSSAPLSLTSHLIPRLAVGLLLSASAAQATPQFGPAELVDTTVASGVGSAACLDVNLDGQLDVVLPATFYGPLRVFLGRSVAGNPYDGGHRVEVAGLDLPTLLHASDLDGDGDQDLLTCAPETGVVSWLPVVGGNDWFGSPNTITTDAHGVEDATTGDIDGDGLSDIVVSAKDRGAIIWFRNLGSGQFASEATIAPSQYLSTAIELVDVEGDGDLDVLTNSELSGFHWYRNLGGGVFGPQIVLEFRMDTAIEVLGGDLDRDGDIDYVGVGEVEGANGTLVLYEGDGAGSFSTTRTTLLTGSRVRTAALLDVDDDGDLDIVYQTQVSLTVRALLNQGGSFLDVALFTSSRPLDRLTVVDADADGRLDLLSWESRFVQWIRNAAPLMFEAGPPITTYGLTRPLAYADVTGDGRKDLVFQFILAVMPNEGNGRFGRAIDSPGAEGFDSAHLVDFDTDGTLDLVGGVDTGAPFWSLAWCRGVGDGTFLPYVLIPFSPAGSSIVPSGMADLDGDGDLDGYGTVQFSGLTFWLENRGPNQDWIYHALPSFTRPFQIIAVDLSLDGLPELITVGSTFSAGEGVAVHRNLGGGSFGPPSIQISDNVTVGADSVADFNGDGLLDMAFREANGLGAYAYLPGNGQGDFGPRVPVGQQVGLARDPVALDWDDDGDQDILIASSGPPANAFGLRFLENLGTGFAPPVILTDGLLSSPDMNLLAPVRFFDLDEDGDLDPVWTEQRFSPAFLAWRRNEREIGTSYCAAVSNSTGVPAVLSAAGTSSAGSNQLTLTASNLPQDVAGFFIASQTQGFVAMPGGSRGNICLSGIVGRYARPGEVGFSGSAGLFSLALDLTNTPTPSGATSVIAGQTWNYQAWYRNVYQGSTSNFTSALSVTFR